MRTIKYRGKRIDNGEWVYGYLFKLNHTQLEGKIYIIPDFASAVYYYEVAPETVGQYTGLKDKNGKEIYGGDIVKIHKHGYDFGFEQEQIGEIKFVDGSFGFYRQKQKNEYYFNELSTENGYGELEHYEVIGNITDNPELLEV